MSIVTCVKSENGRVTRHYETDPYVISTILHSKSKELREKIAKKALSVIFAKPKRQLLPCTNYRFCRDMANLSYNRFCSVFLREFADYWREKESKWDLESRCSSAYGYFHNEFYNEVLERLKAIRKEFNLDKPKGLRKRPPLELQKRPPFKV